MKTTRAVLGILSTAFIVGCGKPSLSRTEAKSKVEASRQVAMVRLTIPLSQGALSKGLQQGMWRWHKINDLTYIQLTEKGLKTFASVSQTTLTLKDPALAPLEITGIADEPLAKNLKEVQFNWKYDINTVAKRFVVDGGVGNATLRLFDDGWRLEGVEIHFSQNPIALTATEQMQEQKDAEKEADRRKALAEESERRTRLTISAQNKQLRTRLSSPTEIWVACGQQSGFRLAPQQFDQKTGQFTGSLEHLMGDGTVIDPLITKVEGVLTETELSFKDVALLRPERYRLAGQVFKRDWAPWHGFNFLFKLTGLDPITGEFYDRSAGAGQPPLKVKLDLQPAAPHPPL